MSDFSDRNQEDQKALEDEFADLLAQVGDRVVVLQDEAYNLGYRQGLIASDAIVLGRHGREICWPPCS